MVGKNSADDILKYLSDFIQKTGFDISCKLSPMETMCMKCQNIISRKYEKYTINWSSAELVKGVVCVIYRIT